MSHNYLGQGSLEHRFRFLSLTCAMQCYAMLSWTRGCCCRWLTLEAAAGNEKPSSTEYLGGRNLTQYLFDSAKASNITVMRTLMGSADDSTGFLLQTAPGKPVYFLQAQHTQDPVHTDSCLIALRKSFPAGICFLTSAAGSRA